MRLHGDTVGRAQHVEIKRRHEGGERGAGGLVAAHLHAAALGADVVGMVIIQEDSQRTFFSSDSSICRWSDSSGRDGIGTSLSAAKAAVLSLRQWVGARHAKGVTYSARIGILSTSETQ